MLNNIGLNLEKSQHLSEKLNTLLSNYQIFYMNLRGFHWNIKGNKFFELHAKFEELYSDALLKVDEIAERILTLGQTPLHAYSDYKEYSSIEEAINYTDANQTIHSVLSSFQQLLRLEREILELASDISDEGTSALMSDYIREQEKLVWMYSAYIN